VSARSGGSSSMSDITQARRAVVARVLEGDGKASHASAEPRSTTQPDYGKFSCVDRPVLTDKADAELGGTADRRDMTHFRDSAAVPPRRLLSCRVWAALR